MNADDQTPFSTVIAALKGQATLAGALLRRFSDMSEAETEAFWQAWSELANDRRHAVVRHLADLSEDNFQVDFAPIFARCMHDEDAQVRVAALDGLWDCTDTRLAAQIIAVMQEDSDAAVRAAAARALAHYVLMAEWGQVPQAIEGAIVTALLDQWDAGQEDLPMRRAVVEALGGASHPRVSSIIQIAYAHKDEELRRSALFAMGSSADPRWLPTVLAEMSHPDADTRAEAARAAGAIGRGDALSPLGELLQDDDRDVVFAAVSALGQLGSEEAHGLLAALAESLADGSDEALLDLVDETLEEMDWLGGTIDFSMIDLGALGALGEE